MELGNNEVEKVSVRPRVLLVEDDPVSAYLIQQMFHAQNLPLDHATNGAIALDMHRQNRYRLVLSDWMMPEMNGVDLCRAFRQLGGPYVYFILCTSKGQKSDRVEAYDAGVDDFMTKPLDRNELHIRLRVALRILEAEEVVQRQKAELEAMNEKLNHLAETDALTGLYNRRRFQEMLEEAIDEHRRAHDSLSLVLMDIDRFKSLNDEFGHLAGDAALKQVAAYSWKMPDATNSQLDMAGKSSRSFCSDVAGSKRLLQRRDFVRRLRRWSGRHERSRQVLV